MSNKEEGMTKIEALSVLHSLAASHSIEIDERLEGALLEEMKRQQEALNVVSNIISDYTIRQNSIKKDRPRYF